MSAVKEAFYEKYAQAAIDQQIKYGIPASVTLAQDINMEVLIVWSLLLKGL
jgi:flagellum-specific peptidoglycan hydrolase FlgJ